MWSYKETTNIHIYIQSIDWHYLYIFMAVNKNVSKIFLFVYKSFTNFGTATGIMKNKIDEIGRIVLGRVTNHQMKKNYKQLNSQKKWNQYEIISVFPFGNFYY